MISETQQLLLEIVGSCLFHKQMPDCGKIDWLSLLEEAEQQAVFPIVYMAIEQLLPNEILQKGRTQYFIYMGTGIRNSHQHGELHKLLGEHDIPYVIIKGMASASYYPDPFRRSMGDVDFLVPKERLGETKELLLKEGYRTNVHSKHDAHFVFRKEKEVLEMHWQPNGVPGGEKGDLCRRYLSDIYETVVISKTQNDTFLIPDAFHHGLIMLLHTATHMINTGIGLRHLCDWAVFAGSLGDYEFRNLFEEKLKTIGLWRFAQLLTQLSTKYLACPEKKWAMEDVDESLLAKMMNDIFDSGNFGSKDAERINEAKLITSGKTGTIDRSPRILFLALTEKSYKVMPVCKKHKVLIPIGWLYVSIKHLLLILRGKRPEIHIQKMLAGAEKRRAIYQEFQLFQ